MALCTFWRGRKSVTNRGEGGDCAVEELFSCRNGQPQQQPRGSIDYVIHSDNQIRFYVINTHTHAHWIPATISVHTHTRTQICLWNNAEIWIQFGIKLHCTWVCCCSHCSDLLCIFCRLSNILIILQLVHKQLFPPPSPFIIVQLTNEHK